MANRSSPPAGAGFRPRIENPRFFELLKKKRIVAEDMITDLLDELEGNALDVLATLIQSGVGTKRQLCQLWCDSIGIAHVDLEKSLFQAELIRKLPERMAWQFYAIPVYKLGDSITVATATPDNMQIKNRIEEVMGGSVNLVFALPQDIEWAIEHHYRTNTALYEFFSKIAASRAFQLKSPLTREKLEQAVGKEAIHQFHVSLILFGITENASEILIHPNKERARISFVIDNELRKRLHIETSLFQEVSENLVKLAGIPPGRENKPGYSRILFPTPGKKFDIRFASRPTDFGKKISLKFMNRAPLPGIPALSELYLSRRVFTSMKHHINARKGLLVISGPPESGKTATAYAVLKALAKQNLKMMTVEDDLKFLINHVEQYQVNRRAGFDRGTALVSCIKQHPRIIYIQRLDDPDIADIVSEALEKEVFIIGEMAADNACEALARCADLKYADAVAAVFNQTLVSRLCDHCKKPSILPENKAGELFVRENPTEVQVYTEAGCLYCRETGFSGRIGIQEFLNVTPALSKLLKHAAGPAKIRTRALAEGFEDHAYDAIKKVLRGLITLNDFEIIDTARPAR